MKIPTLLGLFILFLFVVCLIMGTVYFQKLTKTTPSDQINNLQVANITDTSGTAFWFSNTPIQTQAFLGTSKDFSLFTLQPSHDDRDQNTISKRVTHLVTFKKLSANQNYFIKTRDDNNKISSLMPQFTTLSQTPQASNSATLVGSVVSQDFQPVDDAVVVFTDKTNLNVVAVTQGNYLLPVNSSSEPISFMITNGVLKSEVTVPSSYKNTIPAVILGQNLDLNQIQLTSPSPAVQGIATASAGIAQTPFSKFDLNEDGDINTIDLTILQRNIGKNNKDFKWESLKFMDFNSDGKINSLDLDLLKSALVHK